jgi:hypothetical protein
MAQATNTITTTASPATCELSLRLRLRRAGMRLERNGYCYRLLYGSQVLLDRGRAGHGLSLQEVARYTSRFGVND